MSSWATAVLGPGWWWLGFLAFPVCWILLAIALVIIAVVTAEPGKRSDVAVQCLEIIFRRRRGVG